MPLNRPSGLLGTDGFEVLASYSFLGGGFFLGFCGDSGDGHGALARVAPFRFLVIAWHSRFPR